MARLTAPWAGELAGAGAGAGAVCACVGVQAKLLAGLGLQSVLITDGKSPLNLFNTAKGLMGQALTD